MTFFESAKDILHKVVETTKEDKKYDEKLVLQEAKQKLLQLKEDVSYATTVLEELKKTGWVDEAKFQTLDTKLRDNEHKQEAVTEISRIIEDIRNRYDNLHTDEREKVKTITEALWKSKQSLSGLKNEVLTKTNINYETMETELVTEANEKLGAHRYSSWLKEPYAKHIHEKIEELKNGKKSDELKGWKKFTASVSNWFFGLIGSVMIGKEISEMVTDKVKKYTGGVKQTIEQGKTKLEEGVKKTKEEIAHGSEVIKNVKEKTPEELEKDLVVSRKYIKSFTKKYAHKDLSDEQIERIITKLNLKQELKSGTSEWHNIAENNKGNYLDATMQTIAVPAKVGVELMGILEDEGIVDMKDIAFNIVGNTVEYGLKGFELFGSGLAVVVGKMDIKELNGHIAHLYEKSPLAAKQLLFALVYRSMNGPLMRMVLNTGEFMSKAVIWPLFQGKDDVGMMKNMGMDAIKGNMNTAIQDMKETNELLQKCNVDDTFLKELLDEVEKASKKAELYNSIVVEAQSIKESATFAEDLKKKFPAGSEAEKFITTYEGSINKSAMSKSRFLDNLGATWENETKVMNSTLASVNGKRGVEFKNRGAKLFLGESSVRHLMINFAHNIEAQGKVAHEMLANRNLFDQIADKLYLKKVRAMSEIMHGNELKDKAVWKFNTVEEFSDFTENAKLLARKAPSTVKFLLGKSPIFIIGGLAMSEDGTMSDKMHSLWQGMMGLVPLVGPYLILRDGMRAGDKTNRGEAAVGGALIGVDAVHIFKAVRSADRATKLLHMFTQPVVDMIEIGRFIRQTGKNSIKMVSDGINLVREGKMVGMREKMFEALKATPKKKWAIAAAVMAVAAVGIEEIMPKGIDKEAEVFFTKFKDNPAALDKALSENWPKFDQDTKNECIKYALIAKLGISAEHADGMNVEFKGGTYMVSLPLMMQKEYGNAMLASLQDSIARVEPNAKIQMEVKGLVAHNFRKQLEEKLKNDGEKPENIQHIIDDQIAAMGYNPSIGKS